MKSCIRGERGPPRRGAAPERRGPARPGQDRDGGPPGPVPGDRPLGMGTLHTAPAPAPEQGVPPALPFPVSHLGSGVPPTTGCPYGEGNPCHGRVPPGQTAEDHQTRLGPPPACRGDAEQTPNTLLHFPQHPTAQKAQPSEFQAKSHPASSSAPHLCLLPNTHPGTHSRRLT